MSDRPWLTHYDPGVPETIPYPRVPVFHFLQEAARKYPQQPCTVFRGDMLPYAAVDSLSDRLAAGLAAQGLRKGDRVGICLPNLPQFVVAFYAVLKAGGVVVAMNPQYRLRELEYQVRDSGVEILIGLSSAYELFQSARDHTGLRKIILTAVEDAFQMSRWSQGERTPPAQHLAFEDGDAWLGDLIAAQPVDAQPESLVGPDDIAIFQYSGGTTGEPKGAVAAHRSLVANSLMFRHWLVGLEEGQETTLMAIPMYHVYGMVVGLSVSTLLGAKMVLIPDPRDLKDLLQNIEKHQSTFFPGVPTMYAVINQFPEVQAGQYNLRSIRACISGAAPLLKEVQDRFEALTGAQLMEGYGLSEAPTATHCNPMLGEKRTGSIGLPLPDVDCRIVSLEDGQTDLPVGEAGEMILRSPQVMDRYHNRPQETTETLRNGWLYTGDIARMDAEGYFYIVGRKKELIKVSGFQVWPREIEEVLASHPDVLEAAAAGIPDPIRGEVPKAWVVLRPGVQADTEALRDWCADGLVYYKVPAEIEFRDTLPKTPVGKLLRRELVRQHQELRRG